MCISGGRTLSPVKEMILYPGRAWMRLRSMPCLRVY